MSIIRLWAASLLAAATIGLCAVGGAYADESFDLVVAGGGIGGMSAAIQAARAGLSVAVVEQTDRIGGQITASGVATMDDVGYTRHGIYGEFIDRVRAHYAATDTPTNICLWGADTIAVEPIVAERILLDMFVEAGGREVVLRARVASADVSGGTLTAAAFDTDDGRRTFTAKLFVDATEYGDLIAHSGAAYRVSGCVQDITYSAVVRRYVDGLPDELRLPGPPPGYDEIAPKFRAMIAKDGSSWPGSYPFDVPTHNAYRALPDTNNKHLIIGDEPATWPSITRTSINWANDWPGLGAESETGLSSKYIEDDAYRAEQERRAMNRTLCFIWFMQSELGMTDWSVDDSQGYGGSFTNDWGTADDPLLPRQFAPVLRHFPPMPYVREGRRIVGVKTLTAADILRDPEIGRTRANCPDAVALGEYPIDIHGSHHPKYLEADLGEDEHVFDVGWRNDLGVFGIPLGALIPVSLDGLIAAEKNISTSRAANGAVRLHPAAMHTGQAAGAIAAEAVRTGVNARDVDTRAVQRALIESGCQLALDICEDVKPTDPWWLAAQLASLDGSLSEFKLSKHYFGATLPITKNDLAKLLSGRGLFACVKGPGEFVSRLSFFGQLFPAEMYYVQRGDLTRGEAVMAALRLQDRKPVGR